MTILVKILGRQCLSTIILGDSPLPCFLLHWLRINLSLASAAIPSRLIFVTKYVTHINTVHHRCFLLAPRVIQISLQRTRDMHTFPTQLVYLEKKKTLRLATHTLLVDHVWYVGSKVIGYHPYQTLSWK